MFRLIPLIIITIMLVPPICAQDDRVIMNGVTVVAPPNKINQDPMGELTQLGADWAAIVPYGYSRQGQTDVYYNSERQWWGETIDGARQTIIMAHNSGLKVLLKPHVYVPGAWPGAIDFDSDEDWRKWEIAYESYILDFAQVAQELDVELFCVGTEFASSTKVRHDFWHDLIYKIKRIYSGSLTYAANWDEYVHISFWDELDYIGVDAYFPLSERKTPSVDHLVDAWQPYKKQLEKISHINNRPILFTEYGYLSIDGCANKTWELEKDIEGLAINEQAQANAIAGLFKAFKNEDFWVGGFYWKWFPNMTGHEGYPKRDYTFQGKIAEAVISDCFRDAIP